jgi:glutathione peroxidase
MSKTEAPIYSFALQTLSGQDTTLDAYRGKVLLIVNVASKCVFTPQYAELEKLHATYADRGLAVLGFPCAQFGNQEFGSNSEIEGFCQRNYGVSFPVFSKIDVNGDGAHPLFKYLKHERKGLLGTERIKWNFTKFLVARDGSVQSRFAPGTKPASLSQQIEQALSR